MNWDHISALPHGLDEMVAEGGDNFSAGQRQVSIFSMGSTIRSVNLFPCC